MVSVRHELPLGHLRYRLTDVPPQPNSPPGTVRDPNRLLTQRYSEINADASPRK
jgi:hypothetical protein